MALILSISSSLYGQDLGPRFPFDLTNTLSSSLTLPMRLELDGGMRFSFGAGESSFYLPSLLQVGVERIDVAVAPALLYPTYEELRELPADAPTVRLLRQKMEVGLGFALLKESLQGLGIIQLGIQPFKGGYWEAHIYPKTTLRQQTRGMWHLPVNNTVWQAWDVGEFRRYQVYGGFTYFLGAGFGVNLAQVQQTRQRKWDVSFKKLDADHIQVNVRLERWRKNSLLLGLPIAQFTADAMKFWDQEKVFVINVNEPNGFKAVADLWAGDLRNAQILGAKLVNISGSTWLGRQKTYYFGIPYIAGRTWAKTRVHKIETRDDAQEIWLLSELEKNNGIFTPVRSKSRSIMWHGEHKKFQVLMAYERAKARASLMRENLLYWAERMGQDFSQLPEGEKGYAHAALFFELTLEQWRHLAQALHTLSAQDYAEFCRQEDLNCQGHRQSADKLAMLKALFEAGEKEITKDHKPSSLLQSISFLVRHPLLMRVLLERSVTSLELKLEAVSERFYPVKRTYLIPERTGYPL